MPSRYAEERYAEVIVSDNPMMRAPGTRRDAADPPRTAAVNAFSPGITPMNV